MATIGKTTFTEGHGIYTRTPESPSLNQAMRDVADDLGGIKPAASAVASAAVTAVADAANAVGATPTKAEFDAVVALANDLKAKYNAAVALINDLKAKLNTSAGTSVKTVKG